MQNNTFIAIKKKLQNRTTNENYTIQMENYRIDMKVIEYEQKYNIQWKRSNIANLDMALIFFVKKKFNYLKLF